MKETIILCDGRTITAEINNDNTIFGSDNHYYNTIEVNGKSILVSFWNNIWVECSIEQVMAILKA